MSWAQDKREEFTLTAAHKAEVASLAQDTATQIGDIIDLSGAVNLGPGTPIYAAFMFTTAYAASGAGYLNVKVQASNSGTFASGNITAYDSGNIAEADIVQGTKLKGLVRNQGKRYLRCWATAVDEAATAGVMYGGLTNAVPEAGETTTPTTP